MGLFILLGSVRHVVCETVRLLRDAGGRHGNATEGVGRLPLAKAVRIAFGLGAGNPAQQRARAGRFSEFRKAGRVEPAALGRSRNRGDGGAHRDNDDDDDDDDEEDLEAKLDARSLGPVAGARVRGAAVHADVDAVVSGRGEVLGEVLGHGLFRFSDPTIACLLTGGDAQFVARGACEHTAGRMPRRPHRKRGSQTPITAIAWLPVA